MRLDSKIFGIPLILILMVVVIVVAINVPMALLHRETQEDLNRQDLELQNVQLHLQSVQRSLLTPTATPSATPTPTQSVTRRVVQPTAQPTP